MIYHSVKQIMNEKIESYGGLENENIWFIQARVNI